MRRAGLVLGGAGLLAGVLLARRGYRNALDVRVERRELRPRGLPPELDGTRVLLLSDLHLPGVQRARERLLALVRAVPADLTLIAGDLVETQAGMDDALAFAEELGRMGPAYAVWGSHDHSEPRLALGDFPRTHRPLNDAAEFRAELERRSVGVLVNERTTVRLEGRAFDLLGVDDAYLDRDDLGRAIGERPLDGFSLLLSHSPDVLPEAARRGISLVLAGHTHGGQIAFPLIGAPLTHSRVMRGRRPAGELRRDGTLLYVGRGFGTTGVPLRFGAPPEIALLTLRSPGATTLRA